MTFEQLRRLLFLHDKHTAAYATSDDIPSAVRARYMADMAIERQQILGAIEEIESRLPPIAAAG
jgi:hypothetical protein